jgi:hypothetical protein
VLVDCKAGQNLALHVGGIYMNATMNIEAIIHTVIIKNLQNSPVHTNLARGVKAIRFRRDFHGGKSKAVRMHNH